MIRLNHKKLFTANREQPITEELIKKAVGLHQGQLLSKYKENERMYMTDHDILRGPEKEPYKPDNRLVINYAKYIVDTFGGYHLGIPVKVTHQDDAVNDYIRQFRKLNDAEDSEFELAKLVDIFGHAFIYVYQDEDSLTRFTYNSPMNMLIVHDDSIQERPFFAVRYEYNNDTKGGVGEVITNHEIIDFTMDTEKSVKFLDSRIHVYGKLPIIEMIENDERQGMFDSVKTLINALNKAVSEKANDVDYFADAYLKIIGVELDDNQANILRDSRIINLWGEGNQMDVGFLEKPSADTTQENLIELLKTSIFEVSQVANLSETDFGNTSGTALAFKLHAMSNLAKAKDRKMQSSLNRLYEVVMSVPTTQVPSDAWKDLEYQFTRNVPRNLLEEAQVVAQLDGQVSDETKLKVLSIVDDIPNELKRIDEQKKSNSNFSFGQTTIRAETDNDVIADE